MKKLFYIILSLIFLELITRSFFPSYSNRVIKKYDSESKVSMFDINIYNKKIRKNSKEFEIRDSKIYKDYDNSELVIHLIGDSVSKGYGLRYQDTFFSIMENILNNLNYKSYLISYALSGTSIHGSFDDFKKIFLKDISKKEILLYQFNYNDITPIQNSKLNWIDKDLTIFQKIILETGKLRYSLLNKSTLLSLIQFNIGKIRYKKNSSCEKRGIYALGPYSYSYGAKGFEKKSKEVWNMFENKILEAKNFSKKNDMDFFVLIIPTILDFELEGNSNPYGYDKKCATIDPLKKLVELLNKNEIHYFDPTNYMQETFNNYSLENNPVSPFFDLDSNHPNIFGSRVLGEYFAIKLLDNLSE